MGTHRHLAEQRWGVLRPRADEQQPRVPPEDPRREHDRPVALYARGASNDARARQGEDHQPVVGRGLDVRGRRVRAQPREGRAAELPLLAVQSRRERLHALHGGCARPVQHQRQRDRARRHDDRSDEEARA